MNTIQNSTMYSNSQVTFNGKMPFKEPLKKTKILDRQLVQTDVEKKFQKIKPLAEEVKNKVEKLVKEMPPNPKAKLNILI